MNNQHQQLAGEKYAPLRPDLWRPWGGAENPPNEAYNAVRLREGSEVEAHETLEAGRSGGWYWHHTGEAGDIVAYRAMTPAVVKTLSDVINRAEALDAAQARYEGGKACNPKDAAAVGRVPMHMVPSTLALFAAMGFAEGDSKYIAYNFRVAGVRASVYISALERHWAKWKNGQWEDPKTKVPHLASCASCLAILIDGYVGKTLVDDRPPPIDLDDEFARAEEVIAHVYALNKDKRPVGVEYTVLTHPA